MKPRLRSLVLAVALLCDWQRVAAAGETLPPQTVLGRAQASEDAPARGPEVRWQKEEILRQAHGRKSGSDASNEAVIMVAVPLLLFIGLLAITRLRDF